jgi:hypothetical protein
MDRRSLYDDDVYAWAKQQADALRRLARTRRDLPNELDLENVAEEIEDVGIAQRSSAESYIRQIFVHLIKLFSAPQNTAANHWRGEIVTFHNELLGRLTQSMHQRIDLDTLWQRAVKEASAKLDGEGELTAPMLACLRGCPLTIADLAGEDFDIDAALLALGNSS